jgi:hypothetical protein
MTTAIGGGFLSLNKLYDAGYYPVNPASCIPANTDWFQAMREAIALMLRCDGIALLPDWRQSRGAKIEVRLARELGMDVRLLDGWIR